jgi:hypothetical protein
MRPALQPAPFSPRPSLVESKPPRQLHPLPKGLVELYGLLAVLFVLVPEWMAGGALAGLRQGREGSDLPMTASAWRRVPELRLASMPLAELRLLARQLRLCGYARLNRDQLTGRLLGKIRARGAKALW